MAEDGQMSRKWPCTLGKDFYFLFGLSEFDNLQDILSYILKEGNFLHHTIGINIPTFSSVTEVFHSMKDTR